MTFCMQISRGRGHVTGGEGGGGGWGFVLDDVIIGPQRRPDWPFDDVTAENSLGDWTTVTSSERRRVIRRRPHLVTVR